MRFFASNRFALSDSFAHFSEPLGVLADLFPPRQLALANRSILGRLDRFAVLSALSGACWKSCDVKPLPTRSAKLLAVFGGATALLAEVVDEVELAFPGSLSFAA